MASPLSAEGLEMLNRRCGFPPPKAPLVVLTLALLFVVAECSEQPGKKPDEAVRPIVAAGTVGPGLTQTSTQIWIKTTPGEVTVVMDGIELGRTFTDGTFKPFALPHGQHVFAFSREGYITDEQKVDVSGANFEIAPNLSVLDRKAERAAVDVAVGNTATPAASLVAAEPAKTPEPPPVVDGGRPAYMPCRVVLYGADGALETWWSLRYEGGKLVASRDENGVLRRLKARDTPPEEIDADMAEKPWRLHYKYDEAERLIEFIDDGKDSYKGDITTFSYAKSGKLSGLSDRYGKHNVTTTDKGVTPGLPASNRFKMGPMAVAIRYEYGGIAHPMLGKPVVWGRDLVFGESASFATFPNASEKQVASIEYDGPERGISSMSTYGGGKYKFDYDCRQPMKLE